MLTGGVDVSHVKWIPFDGLGRASRVGLNFTEKGYGIRPALGTSDRGHTAASQLRPGDIDWDTIFGTEGSRWFHTGGIFAALSAETPDVAIEAITAAKRHGTVVSYDLNFRPSFWHLSQSGLLDWFTSRLPADEQVQEAARRVRSYVAERLKSDPPLA